MKIWIDNLTGDVKIISALNHYIGMRHIEVSMFPEFKYMIYIVGAMIGMGIVTALANRRFLLAVYAGLIIACGAAALTDFYLWGYDYGHNLDPTAPIVVPGMSYQPPLIGTKQLLNFTAYSGPDVGGWIFLVAGLTTIGTLVFELYRSRKAVKNVMPALALELCLLLASCSTGPEPLHFGKDACHACRMILMDNKFGAEMVTQKGKVYKFDDLNCLMSFYNSGSVPSAEVKHVVVIDFSNPEKLIDAQKALYVQSESIKSPMASNVAAFEASADLEKLNEEWKGSMLTWEELRTQFK